MKKLVASIIAVIIIVSTMAVLGYYDTHYTARATVYDVTKDEVTLEFKTGSLYSFYGEGYKKGDKVKVVFYNNATENTTKDDEIVKVKTCK